MGVQRDTLGQLVRVLTGEIAKNLITHLLSGTSLGDSQADTQDSIGTELGLVGGAVKLVEESINLGLVLDIKALLDQSRGNDGVDVLDSLGDTLAVPLGLVAIAKLASLVLAYGFGYSKEHKELGTGQIRHEPVEAPEGTMAR